MNECEVWLKTRLENAGLLSCDVVREEAKAKGFKRPQITAARKALGVETINDWAANGETLNWFWILQGKDGSA